jgi:outer membrane lipopolysaccharide assembly protein LptE/RlpB
VTASRALIFPFLATLAGCGYHVAGHADLVPKEIKTISVPAFANVTTRYKLTDRLPQAIAHEFISRTRYRVVSDPNGADAILRGAVINYQSFPTIFDPATNRASGVEMHVILQVSLVERASGKVIFNRPSFDVRERYQISTEPAVYFEESDAALNRVSQQVARQVVTAILENF